MTYLRDEPYEKYPKEDLILRDWLAADRTELANERTFLAYIRTALAIIVTDTWLESSADGITLTAHAFDSAIPVIGKYILSICAIFFSMSTMFAFPYYGVKCLGFVAGTKYQHIYNYLFVAVILLGAVANLRTIIGLIDIAFALMAFPTVITTILLSPHVKRAAKDYFVRLKTEKLTSK